MNPSSPKSQESWNEDDLNEWVLKAATLVSNEDIAPETMPGNASIPAWNESPKAGDDEADEEEDLTCALDEPTI